MEECRSHVTAILFSGGSPAGGGAGWGGGDAWWGPGCESLRGMGSGILGVMYYTPLGLGKGVGGSLSLGPVPT